MSWLCLIFGHREVLIDLQEVSSWTSWFTMDDQHVALEETYLCTRCDQRRKRKALGRVG